MGDIDWALLRRDLVIAISKRIEEDEGRLAGCLFRERHDCADAEDIAVVDEWFVSPAK